MITPLVFLLMKLSGVESSVGQLVTARVLDTIIGIGVAAAVVLLLRLRTPVSRLAPAQAAAIDAAGRVLLAATDPHLDHGVLRTARRNLQTSVVEMRAASDETAGDAIWIDPTADARWPITAAVERLAALALALPTGRDALDVPATSGVRGSVDREELRAALAALASSARNPHPELRHRLGRPVTALPGLPRTWRALDGLRQQLLDVAEQRRSTHR